VLPVFDTLQDVACGRSVALERVGNDDPRDKAPLFEARVEEGRGNMPSHVGIAPGCRICIRLEPPPARDSEVSLSW
jgi:hypothetical protein